MTLTTGYTIVVLMTMYWPSACRRGSAPWTLLGTMAALAVWHIAPVGAARDALPPTMAWTTSHPIYFVFAVGLLPFFAVTLLDDRRIGTTLGEHRRVTRGNSDHRDLVGGVGAGAQGWGKGSGR